MRRAGLSLALRAAMSRISKTLSILIPAFLVTACANPSADEEAGAAQGPPPDPNTAHHPPQQPSGPVAWAEIWEQVTACGQSRCPGKSGFGVQAGGKYYIG